VQPDIVKMGGITGMMQCAAVCYAHGVEFVPHQTQPTVGHAANLNVLAAQMHLTKPVEWNDPSERTHAAFKNPPKSVDGLFQVPTAPGIGIAVDETELARRKRPI
jgi:L-alanine-DL-glutamate epimerase-like enolase superfamily enzyme